MGFAGVVRRFSPPLSFIVSFIDFLVFRYHIVILSIFLGAYRFEMLFVSVSIINLGSSPARVTKDAGKILASLCRIFALRHVPIRAAASCTFSTCFCAAFLAGCSILKRFSFVTKHGLSVYCSLTARVHQVADCTSGCTPCTSTSTMMLKNNIRIASRYYCCRCGRPGDLRSSR